MPVVWDHDRNFWATPQKPEGIFRILCLGDSMTFGSGVVPADTVPAQCQKLLNRTAWEQEVEVINGGVSGFSLYDDWHRFLQKGHHYQPDLLVILVCDNDIELFSINAIREQDKTLTYSEHTANVWKEDSSHFPYLDLILGDIKQQANDVGLPLLVAFYYINGDDLEPFSCSDTAQKMKSACKKHEIDFVDLSKDFFGKNSAAVNQNYVVSSEDGHPSKYAHGIAAQRLARKIIKNKYFDKIQQDPKDELSVCTSLIENADKKISAGYRKDYAYQILHENISAKSNSKTKLKLDETKHLDENSLKELSLETSKVINRQYKLDYLNAYLEYLEMQTATFADFSVQTDSMLSAIYKAIFVLSNSLENPALSKVSYFPAPAGNFSFELLQQSANGLVQLHHIKTEIENILRSIVGEVLTNDYVFFSGSHQATESQLTSLVNEIKQYWHDIQMVIEAVISAAEYLFGLHNKYKPQPDTEIWPYFTGIGQALMQLVDITGKWFGTLEFQHVEQLKKSNANSIYTTCVVKISSTAKNPFCLWVNANGLSPHHTPVSDLQWVERDGNVHTYTFLFPRFFIGQLKIQTHPLTFAAIESIELFNNAERRNSVVIPESPKLNEGTIILPTMFLSP